MKMKQIAGNLSRAPANIHQSSSTTSHWRTSDLHHHFFGFGNQDATIGSELSHDGYWWWTDWTLSCSEGETNIEGNNFNCVLCNDNLEEKAFHVFFSCPFQQILLAKNRHRMEGKPTFLSDVEESPIGFSALVLHDVQNIAAWHIWKQRNNLIFEGRRPTIRAGLDIKIYWRAKTSSSQNQESQKQEFLSWVDSVQI